MKIDSASIVMSSEHYISEKYAKEETLRIWVGDSSPDFEDRKPVTVLDVEVWRDRLELSDEAKKAIVANLVQDNSKSNGDDFVVIEISDKEKQKLQLLQDFISSLTGKEFKFNLSEKIRIRGTTLTPSKVAVQPATSQAPVRQGWGLAYDGSAFYQEKEKMSFCAHGVVKTADGKEINFKVQLQMNREFTQEQKVSIRAGDARIVDPLVVNYNGVAADLTNKTFSFDLDADGSEEKISFVQPGSGFLAWDRNHDGVINNGSELFGPVSGDGFAELAKYDADGNQWIDENDAIYHQLCIWTKDAAGNDSLATLAEKGIGAIYLGNINTQFQIKNQQNQLLGIIQKGSVFIREDGTAGTVQELDLVV